MSSERKFTSMSTADLVAMKSVVVSYKNLFDTAWRQFWNENGMARSLGIADHEKFEKEFNEYCRTERLRHHPELTRDQVHTLNSAIDQEIKQRMLDAARHLNIIPN